MSKSSLSSVVSKLVRASMGTAVSSTVTDEDLDRHVAELILKEAKQKAERYGQHGIRAYLKDGGMCVPAYLRCSRTYNTSCYRDSNAPKPNKRFLSSIIRSTDDHNKTILRAQALAAQEVRLERQEQERRERRARAEEATSAARSRHSRGADDIEWAHNWDRREGHNRRRRDESGSRDSQHDSNGRDRHSHRESRRRRIKRSRSDERQHRRENNQKSKRSRSRRRYALDSDEESESMHYDMDRRTSSYDSEDGERATKRRRARRDDEEDRHYEHHRRSHPPSDYRPSRSRHSSPESRAHKRRRRSPVPSERHIEDDASQTSVPNDEQPLPPAELREHQLRSLIKGKARMTQKSTSPSPGPPPQPPPPALAHNPKHSSRAASSSSRTLHSGRGSPRSPSASPPPLPSAHLPSKMDRYFEDSYDPRLDTAPLNAPQIPSTGLLNDAEFEGWDAMLEIIRQRREDKERKKHLEKLGAGKEKSKSKKSKKTMPADMDRWGIAGLDADNKVKTGTDLMEIEYSKKGAVREWDLGKEGFD